MLVGEPQWSVSLLLCVRPSIDVWLSVKNSVFRDSLPSENIRLDGDALYMTGDELADGESPQAFMDGTSDTQRWQREGTAESHDGRIEKSDLPNFIPHDQKDRRTGPAGNELDTEQSARPTSEEVETDRFSDDELTDDEETGLTQQDKMKRTRRKSRKTSLDQRVAEDGYTAKSIRKLADLDVLKRSAINVLLIGLW